MIATALLSAFLLAAPDSAARPAGLAISYYAVIQVDEPDKAAQLLVNRAEALGGWFSRRSQDQVDLRLPSRRADAFIDSLPALGLIVERNLETQSLEAARTELEARLKAKKATLQDYYAMLKESGDSTIFTLQNVITSLQMDIEQTMQQILKIEDLAKYARVTVSFRFQDRRAPLAGGPSRFRWLNALGVQNLMNRFHYVWK